MLNFTKPKTMVLGSLSLIALVVLVLSFGLINSDMHSGTGKLDAYSGMLLFTAIPVFLIGYALLWIKGKEVNNILSIFNFVFLINSVLFFLANLHTMSMIMGFFCIQIFITNLFFGFRNKMKRKRNN